MTGKYAELSKGEMKYNGEVDLARYYIIKYDILDQVPVQNVDEVTRAVQV